MPVKVHSRCSQIGELAEPLAAFVIDGVIQRSGNFVSCTTWLGAESDDPE